MKVEELQEILAQCDGDAEVRIAMQPDWPLEHEISQAYAEKMEGEPDSDGYSEIVRLVAGRHIGCIPGEISFEEALRELVAVRDRTDHANNEAVRLLGSELGKKYIALKEEVIHAHRNWAMSSELDVLSIAKDGEERRKLLLDTGGYFFVELRTVFWDDAILRLSRLTDQAEQHSHENLSLRALLNDICDPTLRSKVEKRIEEAAAKIEPMRIHRHKTIAHLDLDVSLNRQTNLPLIYAQSVDDALSAVGKVLDQLMEGYTGKSDIHEWGSEEAVSDLENLFYYLEAGLKLGGARR